MSRYAIFINSSNVRLACNIAYVFCDHSASLRIIHCTTSIAIGIAKNAPVKAEARLVTNGRCSHQPWLSRYQPPPNSAPPTAHMITTSIRSPRLESIQNARKRLGERPSSTSASFVVVGLYIRICRSRLRIQWMIPWSKRNSELCRDTPTYITPAGLAWNAPKPSG